MSNSFLPLQNGNPFPHKQDTDRTREFFARFWYDRLWQIFVKKFDFENMPSSINKDFVIWNLCLYGWLGGGKDMHGNLRIYSGTFFKLDGYGFPTQITMIPYHPTGKTGANFTRTVGKDGAFIRLTPSATSAVATISTFAQQLAELDVNLNVNLENLKLARIFVADDGDQAQKMRRFIDDVTAGNIAVMIDDNMASKMLRGNDSKIPIYSTPADYYVDKFIQDKRQVLNEFLTAIGVDSSGANMIKGERNTIDEVNSNNEEIMLNHHFWTDSVVEDFEQFNRIFNTDIRPVFKTKIELESEVENVDSVEFTNE